MSSENLCAPSQFVEANDFTLSDASVSISYSTTSITGDPLFSYRDQERDISRRGEEIRVTPLEIGSLVIVTLEPGISDNYKLTVALLVPVVRVPQGDERAFETVAILTEDRSTGFTGPSGIDGQVQIYRALNLSGTARFVMA